MNAFSNYPDGITAEALTSIVASLSAEIASPFAPTEALTDGSAVARRNARMLARAAAGISPKYGVSLSQAAQEATTPIRAVPVATTPIPEHAKKPKSRRARRKELRGQIVHRSRGTEAA
ncbi:hypothetical protein SK571_42420 [Lentzea sp. BCCO 10_0798]|uniref:Uncharacterized protein n=1 Tax=Lentzea kristufekii TaxID=3095430 RepID=A0ABU4U6J8_9PSEU|nr:hypothetical protein [Lentzea sp. BCCO 10_0798]MDX8056072.1 hypothetical protein [Lentzea sp. BCCO 10_0798]